MVDNTLVVNSRANFHTRSTRLKHKNLLVSNGKSYSVFKASQVASSNESNKSNDMGLIDFF